MNGLDGFHIGSILIGSWILYKRKFKKDQVGLGPNWAHFVLIDSCISVREKEDPSQEPIKRVPDPTGPFLLVRPQRVTDGRNRKQVIHPLGDQYDYWT